MATNERIAKSKRKDSASKPNDHTTDSPKSSDAISTVSNTKTEVCPDSDHFVNEKDKAVSCDICDNWFHKSCQGISDQLYKVLTSNETDSISWYCSACKRGAKKVMLQIARLKDRHDAMEGQITSIEGRHQDTLRIVKSIEDRVEKLESKDSDAIQDQEEPGKTLKEIEDRERRKQNVVIFNLAESSNPDPKLKQAEDLSNFKAICQTDLDVGEVEVDALFRLGPKAKNSNGSRPLKVILKDNITRKQILAKAKNLKGTGEQGKKQLAIAPDMTPMQREEVRKLREIQKTRQEELERSGDHQHVWIIREGKLLKVKVKHH